MQVCQDPEIYICMTSRAIHHWFYIFSEIAACWFRCVDDGWQDESRASAVVFFSRQVAVFFHSFASLILSFWKDLHALIMLQANLNCSESSVLLVRVPCELLRSTCFLGENTFFFYLHSLDFNACASAEEAHAHMSTNRLVPDEHCVLWDLPCSLKIQQQGKEKKKNPQQMRPSSLFIFSIEFSLSNSKPPQSVRWCGVSFCTRPELHFRGSQSADGWKWRIYYNMGSRRTWNSSCYVLHPLQPGKKLHVLRILLCASVIRWHNLENWFGISDANIKKYAASPPTETGRSVGGARARQAFTSAGIIRPPEW